MKFGLQKSNREMRRWMVPENNNRFPLRWPALLAYLFRGGRLLLSPETHYRTCRRDFRPLQSGWARDDVLDFEDHLLGHVSRLHTRISCRWVGKADRMPCNACQLYSSIVLAFCLLVQHCVLILPAPALGRRSRPLLLRAFRPIGVKCKSRPRDDKSPRAEMWCWVGMVVAALSFQDRRCSAGGAAR